MPPLALHLYTRLLNVHLNTSLARQPFTSPTSISLLFYFPIAGACEGQIACSTCHVVLPKDIYDALAKSTPMSEEEQDMLVST